MTLRLQNKVALVTGAAGAIGEAIARRFELEGAKVIALDLHAPTEFTMNVACDLSDEQQIEAVGADILSKYPTVDILVHAAGLSDVALTVDATKAAFENVMAVNVYSAMKLAALFTPGMSAQKDGSVVFISSITGIVGAPNMAVYSASKGALHTAVRTLALEMADDNIRVNSVSPASIDTPMLRGKFALSDDPEQALQDNIGRHPLGRLGKPEDIANMVLFLASDEANWITGCDYRVDGGATINRK